MKVCEYGDSGPYGVWTEYYEGAEIAVEVPDELWSRYLAARAEVDAIEGELSELKEQAYEERMQRHGIDPRHKYARYPRL